MDEEAMWKSLYEKMNEPNKDEAEHHKERKAKYVTFPIHTLK